MAKFSKLLIILTLVIATFSSRAVFAQTPSPSPTVAPTAVPTPQQLIYNLSKCEPTQLGVVMNLLRGAAKVAKKASGNEFSIKFKALVTQPPVGQTLSISPDVGSILGGNSPQNPSVSSTGSSSSPIPILFGIRIPGGDPNNIQLVGNVFSSTNIGCSSYVKIEALVAKRSTGQKIRKTVLEGAVAGYWKK